MGHEPSQEAGPDIEVTALVGDERFGSVVRPGSDRGTLTAEISTTSAFESVRTPQLAELLAGMAALAATSVN